MNFLSICAGLVPMCTVSSSLHQQAIHMEFVTVCDANVKVY